MLQGADVEPTGVKRTLFGYCGSTKRPSRRGTNILSRLAQALHIDGLRKKVSESPQE